ncbi:MULTISPECIES: hypothetical protein [unclassified Nocardia]|nr:hypothetical protein OHA42_06190 [Nocardia sp. NBC_01009]
MTLLPVFAIRDHARPNRRLKRPVQQRTTGVLVVCLDSRFWLLGCGVLS